MGLAAAWLNPPSAPEAAVGSAWAGGAWGRAHAHLPAREARAAPGRAAEGRSRSGGGGGNNGNGNGLPCRAAPPSCLPRYSPRCSGPLVLACRAGGTAPCLDASDAARRSAAKVEKTPSSLRA